MLRESIYQPFEIVIKTMDECPKNGHRHLFFELVYIISGSGMQCINQNKFAYKPGHMFLITPEDCHAFEIAETTKFFFLRFNQIYLKSGLLSPDDLRKMEYILHNASHQPGCILKNRNDKEVVKSFVDTVCSELENTDLYNLELVRLLVNLLIVIVARNIAKYLPSGLKSNASEKIVEILNYLQSNIYHPDLLRSEVVGSHFGISDNYLGKYFKQQTGQSYQQYIGNLKIKLIEARLKFSDLRISEIANEFSFTDESHLNKFFRKAKGISPKEFRKLHLIPKFI
ncbi:transcriptional regulator [Flavobacteriaceae bacterium CRH]|nr:transcriptional regulator [Flavobacteriaceae bacterium CRH]